MAGVSVQERNKALMAAVAQALLQSDVKPLLAALSDDVQWVSNSPAPYFRFGGARSGRERMTEWVGLLSVTYLFHRFDKIEIVAEGDTVWGLFEFEATHLPTHKRITTSFAVRWVMRDGKVVSHQGFFDTAGVLIQQGMLPARPEGLCAAEGRKIP